MDGAINSNKDHLQKNNNNKNETNTTSSRSPLSKQLSNYEVHIALENFYSKCQNVLTIYTKFLWSSEK